MASCHIFQFSIAFMLFIASAKSFSMFAPPPTPSCSTAPLAPLALSEMTTEEPTPTGSVRTIGPSVIPTSVPPLPSMSPLPGGTVAFNPPAENFIPDPNKYYRLRALYEEGSKCLLGNRIVPGAILGGSSYMDICNNSPGQMWKFSPMTDGYYRMTTKFTENYCLEGNKLSDSYTLNGAAFMELCAVHAAQLWKIQHRGAKYFTLSSKFRYPYGECLDGNHLPSATVLNGAAYMALCTVSDQQMFTASEA